MQIIQLPFDGTSVVVASKSQLHNNEIAVAIAMCVCVCVRWRVVMASWHRTMNTFSNQDAMSLIDLFDSVEWEKVTGSGSKMKWILIVFNELIWNWRIHSSFAGTTTACAMLMHCMPEATHHRGTCTSSIHGSVSTQNPNSVKHWIICWRFFLFFFFVVVAETFIVCFCSARQREQIDFSHFQFEFNCWCVLHTFVVRATCANSPFDWQL